MNNAQITHEIYMMSDDETTMENTLSRESSHEDELMERSFTTSTNTVNRHQNSAEEKST